MVSLAYAANRAEQAGSHMMFWIGLLILAGPVLYRLCLPYTKPRERLGLVLVLGMALFAVKLLYSPLEYKFSDELQHWRSSKIILDANHLFQINPILPISSQFPGLQNVTVALQDVTGIGIYTAGNVVIGVARLIFLIALYLLYKQVSHSSYVASLGVVLAMANPHFLFFHAMFIYQALAIPVAVLALFAAARSMSGHQTTMTISYRFVLLIALFVVVTTHHITSFALMALLLFWGVVALLIHRFRFQQAPVIWSGVLCAFLILTWMVFLAPQTVSYLAPHLSDVGEPQPVVAEDETYVVPPGAQTPLWEQILNMVTAGLLILGIGWGLLATVWTLRRNALAMTLALASFAYVGSIGLRFLGQPELMGRIWSLVFVVMGVSIAIGLVALSRHWPWRRLRGFVRYVVVPGYVLVVFAGSITAGWPPFWGRLPGSYMVAASERSIEPESVEAAYWSNALLGRYRRIAADFSNYYLMGAYGEQDPELSLSWVYVAPELSTEEWGLMRYYDLEYLVVDQRLSEHLPVRGRYFDGDEPAGYTVPLSAAALGKFDAIPHINRIFDSGSIIIYQVEDEFYYHSIE